MRTPTLTYEALLAALTLGAASAMVACSKGAAVRSEPAPASSLAPAATVTATALPGPQGQPSPPPSPESENRKAGETSSAVVVDAGHEKNAAPTADPKAPKPSAVSPTKNSKPGGGSAACGGSSCSPDMKKGN